MGREMFVQEQDGILFLTKTGIWSIASAIVRSVQTESRKKIFPCAYYLQELGQT